MTGNHGKQLSFHIVLHSLVSCTSKVIMETLLLLVISLIRSGVSITGYDCGGKQWKSQLTYSSTEVEPCPKVTSWFQSELPVNTQVMRIPKKNRVNATICEVTVSHRVTGVASTPSSMALRFNWIMESTLT